VREIRRVQPVGPYVVGGACGGGVVALEVAQQLRQAKLEVRTLVLIDSFIPRWSRFMRKELIRFWTNRLSPGIQSVRAQGFVGFAREARRRLVDPSPEERIGALQMRIMRTYLARLTAYRPRPYPGQVVLLRAADTDVEEARRWESITTGRFVMHEVPGNHFSHLREYAQATAARLEDCLSADNALSSSAAEVRR
jgi:thioesterase domain-containing protein